MKNCNEIFKGVNVKSVSESMNPEKLSLEKGPKADNRRDWGANDYESIVMRNMGGKNNGLRDTK